MNLLPLVGGTVVVESLQVEEALRWQRERRGLKAAQAAQAKWILGGQAQQLLSVYMHVSEYYHPI